MELKHALDVEDVHLIVSFNRPNVELKRHNLIEYASRISSFNRTIVELKLIFQRKENFIFLTFNRTIVELKQDTEETRCVLASDERWEVNPMREKQIVIILLVGLIAFGSGFGLAKRGCGPDLSSTSVPPVPVIKEVASVESPELDAEKIVVYVTGAVMRTGVYRLEDGMRTEDAIKQAGGVTEVADIASVNFTQKCRDGMQINVKVSESKLKNKLIGEIFEERREQAEYELVKDRLEILERTEAEMERLRTEPSKEEIEKAKKAAELEAARARSRWHNQRSREIAEELKRKKQLEAKQSESEEPNEQ